MTHHRVDFLLKERIDIKKIQDSIKSIKIVSVLDIFYINYVPAILEYISRSIAASEKIFNGLLMCGLIVKIGSLFELVGMVITADCEEVLGNVVKVLKFGGVMLWLDNREIDDGGGIFRYQDAVVESSVGRGVCKVGPQ